MGQSAPKATTLLVTGLSGSGKSTALKSLEDVGFYCIDNLPAPLLQTLVDKIADQSVRTGKLALFMDIRTDHFINDFALVRQTLNKSNLNPQILYLEANDETLIRRYSEMRRRHPLALREAVREGIAKERRLLTPIKESAQMVIDTSNLNPHQLRAKLSKNFADPNHEGVLQVNILSFGFKHGLPPEADTVFDVRFLPNPYFEAELKEKTGKEQAVADYALDNPTGKKFLHKLHEMIAFLVPQYLKEGKVYLTIAIGCTGGRHRSVATAEELARFLKQKGLSTTTYHRDMGKK